MSMSLVPSITNFYILLTSWDPAIPSTIFLVWHTVLSPNIISHYERCEHKTQLDSFPVCSTREEDKFFLIYPHSSIANYGLNPKWDIWKLQNITKSLWKLGTQASSASIAWGGGGETMRINFGLIPFST